MQEVRNNLDKLVCMLDKPHKTVEIVIKGCKTTIQFFDNGTVKVTNTTMVA